MTGLNPRAAAPTRRGRTPQAVPAPRRTLFGHLAKSEHSSRGRTRSTGHLRAAHLRAAPSHRRTSCPTPRHQPQPALRTPRHRRHRVHHHRAPAPHPRRRPHHLHPDPTNQEPRPPNPTPNHNPPGIDLNISPRHHREPRSTDLHKRPRKSTAERPRRGSNEGQTRQGPVLNFREPAPDLRLPGSGGRI